ncbi:MAG: hypothetical protein HY401_01905 [Elusimicrobia bacterium]|nr:hypothetical protein [Elusimicrobiota bacterium]
MAAKEEQQKKNPPLLFIVGGIVLAGVGGNWLWEKRIAKREEAFAETAKQSLRTIGEANGAYFAKSQKYYMGYIDNAAPLVTEKYLNQESWETFPYRYHGTDHPTKPCIVSKAERQGSDRDPYKYWIFCIDTKGAVSTLGETTNCGAACSAGLAQPPRQTQRSAGPFCGNKICDPGETRETCPDCCYKDLTRPCCGDGVCEGAEYGSGLCQKDCPFDKDSQIKINQ